FELRDGHLAQEAFLARERGLHVAVEREHAWPERFDSARELRELLGPLVARLRNLRVAALRLAQAAIELAQIRPRGPEARLVVALQIPEQKPFQEPLLRTER